MANPIPIGILQTMGKGGWVQAVLATSLGLVVWSVALVPDPPAAIIGDSIIAQMSRTRKTLPPPFQRARNLGVRGETASQIADRISSVADAPRVFIGGGTNDLLGHSRIDGIVPAYRRMLEALADVGEVWIVGIPRVNEAAMRLHRADAGLLNNATIAAVNQQLVQLCAEFANCRPAIAAMQMDMRGKTLDGIHLPKATYNEWVRRLAPSLGWVRKCS